MERYIIMGKNNQNNKTAKQNPLIFIAMAVAIVAVAVVLFTQKGNTGNTAVNTNTEVIDSTDDIETVDESEGTPAILNNDGDVVIEVASITEKATFINYDANGTTIGLFAVKANDGTIRTALNTCQVCNGSPKAYFIQKDDVFECQNCGNLFELDQIEQERGGCNPVPIMPENKIVSDTEIIIPASLLDSVTDAFTNWKKF
jgi:uncharacterized membrane protein